MSVKLPFPSTLLDWEGDYTTTNCSESVKENCQSGHFSTRQRGFTNHSDSFLRTAQQEFLRRLKQAPSLHTCTHVHEESRPVTIPSVDSAVHEFTLRGTFKISTLEPSGSKDCLSTVLTKGLYVIQALAQYTFLFRFCLCFLHLFFICINGFCDMN